MVGADTCKSRQSMACRGCVAAYELCQLFQSWATISARVDVAAARGYNSCIGVGSTCTATGKEWAKDGMAYGHHRALSCCVAGGATRCPDGALLDGDAAPSSPPVARMHAWGDAEQGWEHGIEVCKAVSYTSSPSGGVKAKNETLYFLGSPTSSV